LLIDAHRERLGVGLLVLDCDVDFHPSERWPLAAVPRAPRLPTPLHSPERSGLPSAVRGAGAFMSGSPAAFFGTFGAGYRAHCAGKDGAIARVSETSPAVTFSPWEIPTITALPRRSSAASIRG
jgi:hypothetical protein